MRDGRQEGRRHVKAAGRRIERHHAFTNDAQPLVAAALQIAENAALLGLVDHRSEIGLALGMSGEERPEAFGDRIDHLLEDAALDQEAAARRAGLAAVLDDRIDEGRQGALQIGIVEDDLGRFAAEFEGDAHMVLGRCRLDGRAGLRAAGEGEEIDAGMGGERCAGRAAEARHDVERAIRKADLAGERGDAQDRQRGVLGRFHHGGVAGGERRADRAAEDLHRVVPGHDMPGHPVRDPLDADEVGVEIGDHVAVQLVGGTAVEFEVTGKRDGIGPRLAQRLAVVAALQDGEFIGMGFDRGCELHEQAPALRRRQLAPGAAEGGTGGLHGLVDVLGRAGGDPGQQRAVDRREYIERQAIRCRALASANEILEHHVGRERRADLIVHGYHLPKSSCSCPARRPGAGACTRPADRRRVARFPPFRQSALFA